MPPFNVNDYLIPNPQSFQIPQSDPSSFAKIWDAAENYSRESESKATAIRAQEQATRLAAQQEQENATKLEQQKIQLEYETRLGQEIMRLGEQTGRNPSLNEITDLTARVAREMSLGRQSLAASDQAYERNFKSNAQTIDAVQTGMPSSGVNLFSGRVGGPSLAPENMPTKYMNIGPDVYGMQDGVPAVTIEGRQQPQEEKSYPVIDPIDGSVKYETPAKINAGNYRLPKSESDLMAERIAQLKARTSGTIAENKNKTTLEVTGKKITADEERQRAAAKIQREAAAYARNKIVAVKNGDTGQIFRVTEDEAAALVEAPNSPFAYHKESMDEKRAEGKTDFLSQFMTQGGIPGNEAVPLTNTERLRQRAGLK